MASRPTAGQNMPKSSEGAIEFGESWNPSPLDITNFCLSVFLSFFFFLFLSFFFTFKKFMFFLIVSGMASSWIHSFFWLRNTYSHVFAFPVSSLGNTLCFKLTDLTICLRWVVAELVKAAELWLTTLHLPFLLIAKSWDVYATTGTTISVTVTD